MEEVAGEEVVSISSLALSLGGDGRNEHLVEKKFDVGDDLVQLV